MVAGNFDYVQLGMPKRKRTLSPDYPREPQQVYHWLEEIGWQIVSKPACGCFMIICVKNANSMTAMALLALETRYCRQEPFASARYIHVTALKSQLIAAEMQG